MAQKLPQAVQRQIAAAEQISKDLYGSADAADDVAVTDTAEAPTDEKTGVNKSAEQDSKAGDTPASSERADDSKQAPQASKDAPTDSEGTWEARYKTLYGKYQAEVPQLHGKLREMSAAIEQLRAAQAQAAEKPKEAPKPAITADDEDAFGADMIDMVRRAARAEFSQMMQGIEAEAANIKADMSRVQERVVKTDYERYLDKVAAAVPDLDAVNASPEWLAWLAEQDPLMGMTRQQALNMASNAMDAARTVEFFKAFKASRPKPPQRNTALEDSRIEPVSRGSSTAAPQKSERFYTEAEVSQLLDPRYLRTLSPEKARQVEADIDMASAEGRIL